MKSGLYKVSINTGVGLEMSTFVVYSEKDDKYYGAKFDGTDQEGLKMLMSHERVEKQLILEDEDLVVAPISQND